MPSSSVPTQNPATPRVARASSTIQLEYWCQKRSRASASSKRISPRQRNGLPQYARCGLTKSAIPRSAASAGGRASQGGGAPASSSPPLGTIRPSPRTPA